MPARRNGQISYKHTNARKTLSDICESDRSQGRARHAQSCTAPLQISQAPIPDVRSSPRARIALIGQPLLPKQLQRVEARPLKKRCHGASAPMSCT